MSIIRGQCHPTGLKTISNFAKFSPTITRGASKSRCLRAFVQIQRQIIVLVFIDSREKSERRQHEAKTLIFINKSQPSRESFVLVIQLEASNWGEQRRTILVYASKWSYRSKAISVVCLSSFSFQRLFSNFWYRDKTPHSRNRSRRGQILGLFDLWWPLSEI